MLYREDLEKEKNYYQKKHAGLQHQRAEPSMRNLVVSVRIFRETGTESFIQKLFAV